MLKHIDEYVVSLGISSDDKDTWVELFSKDLQSGKLAGERVDGVWYVYDDSSKEALDTSDSDAFRKQLSILAKARVKIRAAKNKASASAISYGPAVNVALDVVTDELCEGSMNSESCLDVRESEPDWIGYDDGLSSGVFTDLKGGEYSREYSLDGELRDCFGRTPDQVNNW